MEVIKRSLEIAVMQSDEIAVYSFWVKLEGKDIDDNINIRRTIEVFLLISQIIRSIFSNLFALSAILEKFKY